MPLRRLKTTFGAGCAAVLAMLAAQGAPAAEFLVSSALDITNAMQSAQPGDTLIMTNGDWTNQQIELAGDGTPGAPITLRAQTQGMVKLNGSSTLKISGDWLVVDGLNFDGGSLSAGNVVEFRGSNGEATNSRFTNSAIVDYNPADINTRYFWVSLYGQSNRVDHNYFSGQSHSGVTVTVWRDSSDADLHRIDNNYFADRPAGNGNGFETIRIGTSDESLSDSFTVVENNLFERVDGEIEIISNKSGSNAFRYNTFRESSGTLTLRHGNDNLVEGNFFLGAGKSGSGGVRVIGERQTIVNNYFQGLDGRANGAISISAGVPGSALNEYFQVKDAVIAHNTIVDVNNAAITFDHDYNASNQYLLAEDVTIANNAIWSTQDPLFEGAEGPGWTWQGNVAFGQSLGPATGNPGIMLVDPQFVSGGGLYRPSPTSPLINNGAGDYSGIISDDMDGQPRIGVFDIGADEFSAAAILRKPLTAADVGPTWLSDPPDPPSGGGCGLALGCAIQAEDYTAILDPDGDGKKWSIVAVANALGGEVLKAPGGDRVDLASEQHDTIATYDLTFGAPGTYVAYYRARGFDGSSDSLFTPDGFGVDPAINESLSNNGAFRWERNPTAFTITESLVDVPLEFRLAMREQHAELDAFVLSMNAGLTDEQLDALFTVLDGDYNLDGVVDASDYTVWRDSLGMTGAGLPADGDASGLVDEADYLFWRQNFGASLSGVAGSGDLLAVPEPGAAVLASLCAAALSPARRVVPTPAGCLAA